VTEWVKEKGHLAGLGLNRINSSDRLLLIRFKQEGERDKEQKRDY